jgi:hypothetical protein
MVWVAHNKKVTYPKLSFSNSGRKSPTPPSQQAPPAPRCGRSSPWWLLFAAVAPRRAGGSPPQSRLATLATLRRGLPRRRSRRSLRKKGVAAGVEEEEERGLGRPSPCELASQRELWIWPQPHRATSDLVSLCPVRSGPTTTVRVASPR